MRDHMVLLIIDKLRAASSSVELWDRAPPNVPADRVKALRDGFWAAMQDKEFLEEADKAKLEITPVKGDEIQQLVVESYKVAPEIAKKAGELIK